MPLYLADDCRLVSDSTQCSLQSADVFTCVVLRTLNSYGDSTFAATGPRLWNSPPVQLHNPDITYGLFRWQLKGHLFQETWTWRSVTSDMWHHRQTLTYLNATVHTHTHLTSLFLGLPRWAGTRKVKPMWILQKQETVSGSGISWPICKSAPCSRQTTTPAPHHTVCYGPDALPATQPTESKHWRQVHRKNSTQ